jgi:hypothetical protein
MKARRVTSTSRRLQRWLIASMLAINLAGIALYTGGPHGAAPGLLPLSMLAAALP